MAKYYLDLLKKKAKDFINEHKYLWLDIFIL